MCLAGRKPSGPQIIYLLFSSFQLSCTPFLYFWTFYPQLYLFSFTHYFLAFFFSPRSALCVCQFHARPVIGESPRALKTIRQLFPFQNKRRRRKKEKFLIISHLLSLFSVAISQTQDGIIFFFFLDMGLISYFIFHSSRLFI